ncbi:MAG TPA: ornithine--oxo-acid transaminase [Phycisphaerae bacterium]|jgi:ornithine--oxo-acid transaminase|nr:ornithine--oxo-acid transaminase [Phycisphaerae bacterium]HPM22269.1 ornithine--oxo-acid transaminase [Phycisphaerae bacterium]HQL54931.1 ornithine--oxo-acid transaminase [Phycisphaerae bacterium]
MTTTTTKAQNRTGKLTGAQHIELVEQYAAHNYHPLPVVVAKAEGVWVEDADGKRYMDMLAAYSAVNFGHCNAELIAAARAQLDSVTLTSRAFHNDQLGPFCRELAALCKMEMVLPMNTGAEGVETALKTARRWGYQKKGVPDGKAKIICCAENFHGRTTTIISFSTDPDCRKGFGPFTPGFETIPYGDIEALKRAIDDHTVAFLVEPIQGEAGIIIPPDGYLRQVREVCSAKKVLFIADEIQSGLGRTGATFACDHEGVQPDMYILGKALGGGIVPISAVVSKRDILGVFTPGSHGSTFGGNPLACAVARKVIEILETNRYQENARQLGQYLAAQLRAIQTNKVKEYRCRGLWVGVEFKKEAGVARQYCEALMREGMLCKDTHAQTMRLAPPLCITKDELDWALARLRKVLA